MSCGLRAFGRLVAVTIVALLGTAGVANATTFTVTTTNDSNDGACTPSLCSLRDAVVAADTAGTASTIDLPAGTYKLTIASTAADDPTTGDLDINNGAAVTITGAGSGSTVVDPNGIDRAFAVQNGASLSLSGMTIELGSPSSSSSGGGGTNGGGAIWDDGGLTVTGDVVFEDNSAVTVSGNGGAIYTTANATATSISGATFTHNAGYNAGGAIGDGSPALLTVNRSTFSDNSAIETGGSSGAIDVPNAGSPITITQSSFTGNRAYNGGAINYYGQAAVTITGSSFSGNQADQVGGAVDDQNSTSMTAAADKFSGNYASDGGGALQLSSSAGNYTLNQDEFDGNTAGGAGGTGGALRTSGQSPLMIESTSMIGNVADSGGAIGLCDPIELTMVNDTVSQNSAFSGGGLDQTCVGSAAVQMTNDTIAFNSAASGQGGGIFGAGSFVSSSFAFSGSGIENTIVAQNTGGDCGQGSIAAGDEAAGHNLDGDGSCFGAGPADKTSTNALLGQPADNTGPVLTDAELAGSPAIDAGTDAGCPATDARGIARPQGAACDIGAFEAAPATLALSVSAPASATINVPITYTLSVSNGGPGPSTDTTVVDQLPAGETLYGASSSQGSCEHSGAPAEVTCSLGNIAASAGATVTIVAAEATPGTVTDTATASNGQGSSVHSSATTTFAGPGSTQPAVAPTVITGPAIDVGKTKATTTGTLGTGGLATTYFVQFGTTKGYGGATATQQTSASGGVLVAVTKLKQHTRYHYRLVAINAGGFAFGADRTFKTHGRRGRMVLEGRRLIVTGGRVHVRLRCSSSTACHGLFSITAHAMIGGRVATVVCTVASSTNYKIAAGRTKAIDARITPVCMSLLNDRRSHALAAKLTARPRSGQGGLITLVTLRLGLG